MQLALRFSSSDHLFSLKVQREPQLEGLRDGVRDGKNPGRFERTGRLSRQPFPGIGHKDNKMICGVDVKRDESPYDLVKTLAQKNSLDRRGDWNGARALSTVQQMLAQHGWRTTTINCLPASAAVPPWEALQLDSLSLDGDVLGDVSVDDGAMARATDWLRGAEQRHAEGAEAEAPHVELAIESE